MKKLFLAAILFATLTTSAQVKIGSAPASISTNANLDVQATNGNHMVIQTDNGNVGIGTITPGAKLEINNSTSPAFKLVDGTQGNSKFLQSDANGNASWVIIPGVTITPAVIGSYPADAATFTSTAASGYQLITGQQITLTAGKWIVSAGFTLRNGDTNSTWMHIKLSSSNTIATEAANFTFLGPAGTNSNYAGTSIGGSGLYSLIQGSQPINVGTGGVTLYIWIENTGLSKWQYGTANYENYFYAIPIN